MTTQAPPFPVDDREFYPLHEEDDVSETELHDLLVDYLCDAFRARFPLWRVFRNVCIYWDRGNTTAYRAPDVFVVKDPISQPDLRVYHMWQDPPVLFVAEVGSRSTFREDEGPKVDVYASLVKAKEYLYYDPERALLRLWRMGSDGAYEEAVSGANGRMWSVELELGFGVEAGFLRAYTPTGERLRSHKEAERDREEAEVRAAEEAQRRQAAERERRAAERDREEATTRAVEEARRRESAERERRDAEARAAEAAAQAEAESERRQSAERARREAQARALEEARQREAAEAQAAEERKLREEVEHQLAAMQAELKRRIGDANDDAP
jgi:Uma2 family endonuclease